MAIVRRGTLRIEPAASQGTAGTAPLAILALFASVACVIAACGGGGSTSGATSTPPSPTPTPTPSAQDVLTGSAGRLGTVKTFHFLFDHENGGLPIVLDLSMRRAEGDMVVPDRLRADVSAVATRLGNLRVDTQFVAVGEEAKIRNPFDRTQWVAVPGKSPLTKIFDPAAGAIALLGSVDDATITGTESVDGVQAWRVEGMLDATDMKTLISTAEEGYRVKGILWIGQDDGLLYRVRLEGPFGKDDPKDIVRKLEFSRYDQPITIDLP